MDLALGHPNIGGQSVHAQLELVVPSCRLDDVSN